MKNVFSLKLFIISIFVAATLTFVAPAFGTPPNFIGRSWQWTRNHVSALFHPRHVDQQQVDQSPLDQNQMALVRQAIRQALRFEQNRSFLAQHPDQEDNSGNQPQENRCLICLANPPTEPVVICLGNGWTHTFCRNCITWWIQYQQHNRRTPDCPACRRPLDENLVNALVPTAPAATVPVANALAPTTRVPTALVPRIRFFLRNFIERIREGNAADITISMLMVGSIVGGILGGRLGIIINGGREDIPGVIFVIIFGGMGTIVAPFFIFGDIFFSVGVVYGLADAFRFLMHHFHIRNIFHYLGGRHFNFFRRRHQPEPGANG